MGMTIEHAIDKLLEFKKRTFKDDNVSELSQALSIAFLTMKNYQILKNSYNDKLKADMVAILTEIQMEIREYHEIGCDEDCNNCRMVGCVEPVNVIKDLDIIRQKINELKGENNEN